MIPVVINGSINTVGKPVNNDTLAKGFVHFDIPNDIARVIDVSMWLERVFKSGIAGVKRDSHTCLFDFYIVDRDVVTSRGSNSC